MPVANRKPKASAAATRKGRRAARGSVAYVVEYPSFNAETRNFCWRKLVVYNDRATAEKVVNLNKRKAELRYRKLEPQNASDQR